MKIVLFHPVSLPPRDYGGIERVVLWLAEGLRDLGHSVVLAALEGSRAPKGVELLPIPSNERSAALLPRRLPKDADVIHFHAPPEKEFFARCDLPSLTTVHGNGKPGEIFPLNSVFLSRDHAERHGRSTFVYNGINAGEFRLSRRKRSLSPLFLSKTSLKTKNLSGAYEVARHAGLPLTIAGGYRPISLLMRSFFSPNEWVGPVADELKAKLLAEASCLLFPIRWAEPFGLVMVEALLSGTPVIAPRIGSVPEVLGDWGGRVLPALDSANPHSLDLWAEAIYEVEGMDPERLRATAIEHFSHHRMATSYLNLYRKVLRGERFDA